MKRLIRLATAAGLYEARCPACCAPFMPTEADGRDLCPDCRDRVELRVPTCPRCGLPRAVHSDGLCGECLADPPPWERFRMIGLYEGLLRELILRGKFGADAAVLALLGRLLARRCRDLDGIEAVVPVPLHPQRLRERGFNQCLEAARPLARILHVPLAPELLQRRTNDHPQRGLKRSERLTNLKQSFAALPAAAGRRVLLTDDIMTTGATLRQAAQALCRAGATVDAVVAARTSGR